MLNPVVYLPIEIKNREWESRLLIACHLLEQGISVVFGQQWAVFQNAPVWPKGVILFKTVNDIQARNMELFAALGHFVAATDEEVLNCERDFLVVFSPRTAKHCRFFFAQNNAQATCISENYPEMQGNVVVTGNPRIDMMRKLAPRLFAQEVERIKNEYGPYILVNSSSAGVNSIWGDVKNVLAIEIKAGSVNPNDAASVARFNGNIQWQKENRDDLIEFTAWAADAITTHTIVVRPHPAELPEFWNTFASQHPRVKIVHKEHHIPWNLGADLLVHTGCTTGLESAILGCPVVNIERNKDPLVDRITADINPTFQSVGDARDAALTFLRTGGGPIAAFDKINAELERIFPGFKDGQSARLIAQTCADAVKAGAGSAGPVDWKAVKGYQSFRRSPQLIEKISATLEDVANTTSAIRGHIGAQREIRLSQIDDSLFVFDPVVR